MSEAKVRIRAQKRAILRRLGDGPASLPQLAEEANAEEREARAILMRLIRQDVVRNTGDDGYELWSDTIARLRAKQLPDRSHFAEQPPSAFGAVVLG